MLFSGTDDNQWHGTAMADRAVDRMAEYGHAFEYDHRAFDGAGHSMPIPYLPTYGSSASPSYSLGGGPVANARASREHWTEAVETLAGADDGFEAEQPPVEPERSAQPSGEELLTRAAWLLAGGVGVVALAAVALLVAFGPTTAKSRFVDGPVSTLKRTANWAWTREESDRTSSKDTLLYTAVMYATALGLVLLAGGVLLVLQYRSVATPLLVFGIWFTTFVGSMNVVWELLQLREARCESGTDGRGDDGPRRELAPEFRPSRDAKIGFVVTVVALGALLLSFRLAVALTRLF